MAKGVIAKQNVIDKIRNAFGTDFIGEYDKKIYVWSDENGERVQIAIAMTCPKNPIGEVDAVVGSPIPNFSNEINFEEVLVPQAQNAITEDEKQNIAALMQKLGLM